MLVSRVVACLYCEICRTVTSLRFVLFLFPFLIQSSLECFVFWRVIFLEFTLAIFSRFSSSIRLSFLRIRSPPLESLIQVQFARSFIFQTLEAACPRDSLIKILENCLFLLFGTHFTTATVITVSSLTRVAQH